MKNVFIMIVSGIATCVALAYGCDAMNRWGERNQRQEKARVEAAAEETWNGHCHDESMLLATTSGSPDYKNCPHRLHRMHYEAVTKAGEEIGALITCICQRDGDGGP